MALKKTAGLSALVVLALAGTAVFFLASKEIVPPVVEKELPEVRLQGLDGAEMDLVSLRGKPALINLWATWCPFCRAELSDFAKLGEAYGDKLAVVAVNRGEPEEVVRQFSLGNNLENILFLVDGKDSLYEAIGGFSMPETIFLNAEGRVVAHKRGPMSLEEMKRRVEELFDLP